MHSCLPDFQNHIYTYYISFWVAPESTGMALEMGGLGRDMALGLDTASALGTVMGLGMALGLDKALAPGMVSQSFCLS